MFNNANNGSTSSLSSLQDERPERKRHQGWRKPVPKFIPDPPKQHSLLSNASALRRMALLTSGDERPPLPVNWRENIQNALGKEGFDVERPASPTPEADANIHVIPPHGVTSLQLESEERLHREEKALPLVPGDRHEANPSSDASSTLAGSAKSMKLEASENSVTASSRSLRSGRSRSLPSINRASAPTPPGVHAADRRTDGDTDHSYVPCEVHYRIVYPRGLDTPSLDTTRRHVAVFPVFPGSNTDLSIAPTAVDSREDVRSSRNRYASTDVPSLLKPGASSLQCSNSKRGSLTATFGLRPRNFSQRMRHALREWFCLNATPAKY